MNETYQLYLQSIEKELAWRQDVGDIVDELHDHLSSSHERLISMGLNPSEAVDRTICEMGSPEAVASSFLDDGYGGVAYPSRSSRAGGLAFIVAGLMWLSLGLSWSFSYYRPASWVAVLNSYWSGLVSVAVLLTSLGVISLASRLARPVTAMLRFGSASAALAAVVAIVCQDSAPVWAPLLGASTALSALAYNKSFCVLRISSAVLTSLKFWFLPTLPLQLTIGLIRPQVADGAPLGWLAGFALLGISLIKTGSALSSEHCRISPPEVDLAQTSAN
ncbi:hypothetical protein FDO65_18110 [Nakamurella flava]|uniref:Uncharacterized protein n=1 Tax=Nakamurella flava TaxID=2576308 RepID=A0A4U6QA36_9ACTN|nr:hypothetical protein [Nakamurella flava]TKV56768.1 hypothetical protein FDO65_18110 [Nakamurella flava]